MLVINGLDCFCSRHNDASRAIDEAGLQAPWRGMSRYERDIYEKNYNLETIAVHLASISISNSEEAVGDWTGRASTSPNNPLSEMLRIGHWDT